MSLRNKKILFGITGGIAAYKSCEVLRELQKRGASVRVVMTATSERFVGHITFSALSNYPVYTSTSGWDARPFSHIDYTRWADTYLIAPCSATSLARFATGFGEEPVSLCFLAMQGEKIIAPAMNSIMYGSPAVQKNIAQMKEWGVNVINPVYGHLACGEYGPGKFPEPESIADYLEYGDIDKFSGKPMALITMGRTEEAIDPVRYISNRSSGITGKAIAKEFLRNGYRVTAICGPMEASLPSVCERINVQTSEDMLNAVMKLNKEAAVIVHCAAVADYRPKNVAEHKIKSSRHIQSLELEETPNILHNTIKKKAKKQIIVSFALETNEPIMNAEQKFNSSNSDILVLNTPISGFGGFGKNSVEYAIFKNKTSIPKLEYGSKEDLAKHLVEAVIETSVLNDGK